MPATSLPNRILVVDDDAAILQMIEAVLLPAGYRVLLADSAWEAIRLFQAEPQAIRLLVADVVMPDLTGPVLAQRLLALQPDLNILFISGYHDSELVTRIAGQRSFGLLHKPFTMDGLLRAVRESLHEAEAPRSRASRS